MASVRSIRVPFEAINPQGYPVKVTDVGLNNYEGGVKQPAPVGYNVETVLLGGSYLQLRIKAPLTATVQQGDIVALNNAIVTIRPQDAWSLSLTGTCDGITVLEQDPDDESIDL